MSEDEKGDDVGADFDFRLEKIREAAFKSEPDSTHRWVCTQCGAETNTIIGLGCEHVLGPS